MKLFKNGVGRPSNEVKKKRRFFVVLVCTLIIIILAIISFVFISRGSNNNSNLVLISCDNDEQEKYLEKLSNMLEISTPFSGGVLQNKSIDISKELNSVEYKFDYVFVSALFDSNISSYGFNIDYKNFDIIEGNKYKMGGKTYDVEPTDHIISYDNLNKLYKQAFIAGGSLKKQNYLYEEGDALYIYSKNTNSFLEVLIDDGIMEEMYFTNFYLESYEIKGNKLYINTRYAIKNSEVDESKNDLVYYLRTSKGKLISTISEEMYDDEAKTCKKYFNKFDKYRFIYVKENGIYKFYKVKKLAM